jgi:hypothetical protein
LFDVRGSHHDASDMGSFTPHTETGSLLKTLQAAGLFFGGTFGISWRSHVIKLGLLPSTFPAC